VSALPQPPLRLLSVAEYAELGETEPGYTELVEGRLLMSPSPAPDHNTASLRLAMALLPRLPDRHEVIQDVDVDLELAAPGAPGFSRRPDQVVAHSHARERVRENGGLVRASEVMLAVEIVSPGSRRTDRVVKREEYAEAGIPYYWIVDIERPVSLLCCHLAGEFGYADSGERTGEVAVGEPFEVTLRLNGLLH
jgi:Uma2 family endonuclease